MICTLCGADTRVKGYIYGACNDCVKRLVWSAEARQKAEDRIYRQAVNKAAAR